MCNNHNGPSKHSAADPPSKSQRKREMLALQELGEALVQLPAKELTEMPLPDALRAAIEEARSLTKRGALRRQKQYIGKLMRSVEVAPIQEAFEARRAQQQLLTRQFHQAEAWRDRLIAEGEAALGEFLGTFPNADRRRLSRLLQDIGEAGSRGLSKTSQKRLFRYLRSLIGAPDR